jgi:hypothetical protein
METFCHTLNIIINDKIVKIVALYGKIILYKMLKCNYITSGFDISILYSSNIVTGSESSYDDLCAFDTV